MVSLAGFSGLLRNDMIRHYQKEHGYTIEKAKEQVAWQIGIKQEKHKLI